MMPMLLFFGALLVMIVLVAAAFSGPSAAKARTRRLDAIKERHTFGGENIVEAKMRRIIAARQTKLDGFATQFIPNPALLRKRIAMTGKSWTLSQYVMASGAIFAVVLILCLAKGAPILLTILLALAAGIGIPHFVIGFLTKRRVNQFTVKFPEAIELLVRGLRSGLPISETLGVVGTEMPGPVGVEFRSVSDKMKIGRTMDAALQEVADRLGTPEFQFFVITLQIQRETGGNLAETLSNLADVLRKRAQMKLKIKAMSSESKASAYIVGSLPFIVFGLVYMVNPKYMMNFFVDERLIIAGMGGLFWMSLGVFIMAKMVNFEI